VRRVDGREEHLSPVDLQQALMVYEAIPWNDEVEQWKKIDSEFREASRPVLSLSDDAGHSVHLTPHSDDLVTFSYEYPYQESDFGFALTDKQGHFGTNQFPRSEVRELMDTFLTGSREEILRLIETYPSKEE
jgi:hypothetical protein